MAFSTKISFVPRDSGQKSVSFNEVEYGLVPLGRGMTEMADNILNNFKSLHFREINNYYSDYVSVVTIDEFLDFHKLHHKTHIGEQELIEFLHTGLQKVRYNWVIIEVYEWESGSDYV